MKRKYYALALGFTLAGAAGYACWTAYGLQVAAPQGDDEIFVQNVNFGLVKPDMILTCPFEVFNRTGDVWHVQAVESTCSCVSAVSAPNTIEPAETLVLPLSIRTGRSAGKIRQMYSLVLAPEPLKKFSIVMTANVQPAIAADPATITHMAEERTTSEIALHVSTHHGLRPDTITIKLIPDWMEVKGVTLVEPSPAPTDTSWRVVLAVKATAPGGSHQGTLLIRAGETELPVRYDITVRGSVAAHPDHLDLGTIRPDRAVERSCLIRAVRPVHSLRVVDGPGGALKGHQVTQNSPVSLLVKMEFLCPDTATGQVETQVSLYDGSEYLSAIPYSYLPEAGRDRP